MNHEVVAQNKDNVIEFEKLETGDCFTFFDLESFQRGNHTVYMKIRVKENRGVDVLDLHTGETFAFSEKKRVTLSDPDGKIGSRVHKLNAKVQVII